MKFINQFKSLDDLNVSINSIKHKDYAYIFNTKDDISNITFYDQRHPGGRCIHVSNVNMNALKIDSTSIKKDINIGDILYATNKGTITLDKTTNNINNTPIAICVIPNVKENQQLGVQDDSFQNISKFVSLNYMYCQNPIDGNNIQRYMYFGNYNNKVGANIDNSLALSRNAIGVGGKYNTQKIIDSIIDKENLLLCDRVTNNYEIGNCPPVLCCNAYNTLGTNAGDWYLPSNIELMNFAQNFEVISDIRKNIIGTDYYKGESVTYWTSTEYNETKQCIIDMDINVGDRTYGTATKNWRGIALAYLNVII